MGRVGVEEGWEFVGRVGEWLGDVGVWESWVSVEGIGRYSYSLCTPISRFSFLGTSKDSRKEGTRRGRELIQSSASVLFLAS